VAIRARDPIFIVLTAEHGVVRKSGWLVRVRRRTRRRSQAGRASEVFRKRPDTPTQGAPEIPHRGAGGRGPQQVDAVGGTARTRRERCVDGDRHVSCAMALLCEPTASRRPRCFRSSRSGGRWRAWLVALVGFAWIDRSGRWAQPGA
jgi:hypothetical protein